MDSNIGAYRFFSLLTCLLLPAANGEAVPNQLDPLKVAPHMHELVLENDRVRVIRQTIRNGETQSVHAHPERVIVYLQSCAWLEGDGEGGERMQLFKPGDVVWAPEEAHGGNTAKVVTECKLLEIELL